MFVTNGQFYIFVALIAFGGLCGIFFSISTLVKYKLNNVILKIIPDVFAFIITAVLFVVYSNWLSFPNFRAYMAVAVVLGISIYFKSFHILLAKCIKRLYNKYIFIYSKLRQKIKLKDKRRDGRIQG